MAITHKEIAMTNKKLWLTLFWILCLGLQPHTAAAQAHEDRRWFDLLMTVSKELTRAVPGRMPFPEVTPAPEGTPTPPKFKIPVKPYIFTPELIDELDDFKDLMKKWPWERIIKKYDLDGDGKISQSELEKFLYDRTEWLCGDLLPMSCDELKRVIEDVLNLVLNPDKKWPKDQVLVTPELIDAWLDHVIEIEEFFISWCDSKGDGLSKEDQADCDAVRKRLDALKKLRDFWRDKLRPKANRSLPSGGSENASW